MTTTTYKIQSDVLGTCRTVKINSKKEKIITKLKLPQYNLYKFTTFKFFISEENQLYNKYKSSNGKQKSEAKVKLYEKIKSFTGTRKINSKYFTYQNQVSWFTNDLLNLFVDKTTKQRTVIEDIIIINAYHDEIFNQIMDNGFYIIKKKKLKSKRKIHYSKKKYIFYTAGPGQQRKQNLTFISEKALKKYNNYLMGGLTEKQINENGGINTGKLLAYKALTMSAGIPVEIPYEKIIVVPDFITNIKSKVQYIDTNDKKLPVNNKMVGVEVNHMDGAGIYLPGKIKGISGNWQFRNKWCKGALVEFDFLTFAKEIAENTIVRDIYNIDHDIEKEDVWIILTSSQFKMNGHYNNWESFSAKMKEINSKFYICGFENPSKELKQLSYQYLSTLDIPVEDKDTIARLCQPTIDYIKKLHKDKEAALKALGATEENKNLMPFQESLLIYSQLLQDNHTKTQIENVIKSIRKDAKGGRILSQGYYSYIFPDVYAFCQRLFQNIEDPKGLIPKGYVYNAYHNNTDIKKVDLLRSPHLHPSEHCVRKLIKSKECQDWFRGNATYVSVHDLAQLQMKSDCDGDVCYIGTFQDLINNIRKKCLPLYYDMPKAQAREINQENIKDTLRKAFEENQIGDISNALTKYLSMAYDENFKLDMKFIARLQALNNFTIDFPKTGINIELPKKDKELYEKLIAEKSPYFFRWAKGKTKTAVAPCENGVVDRISKYIQKNAGHNKYEYFTNEKFNYAILSSGSEVDRSSTLYNDLEILLYRARREIKRINEELSKLKREEPDNEFFSKYDITYHIFRDKMIKLFGGNVRKCVDYLIDIEYCQEYRKDKSRVILWNCFGWEILRNIKYNLKSNRELKARTRYAYKKEDKHFLEELNQKMDDKLKPLSVSVTNKEYKKIKSFTDKNEKNLYYVLVCLSKLNKKHEIKIYNNSKFKKSRKLNINTLNNFAEITNAEALLIKFNQNNIIKLESGVLSVISIIDVDKNQDDICFVVENVWNPLVSLAEYEGKPIGTCKICGNKFIKIRNAKTCSNPVCAEENERRNKKKNYNKNKTKTEEII